MENSNIVTKVLFALVIIWIIVGLINKVAVHWAKQVHLIRCQQVLLSDFGCTENKHCLELCDLIINGEEK